MSDTYPPIYEADEIAQMLQLTGWEGDQLHQEWTQYDELGRQFIVDLPATGQAFLVSVEPYLSAGGDVGGEPPVR